MPSMMIMGSNQAIASLLHTLLEDAQHTVSSIPLDLQAVRTLHDTCPDLALVEVGLGSAALGWAIVEYLRTDTTLRDLPVVVYSVDRADLYSHAGLLNTSAYHTLMLPATVEEIGAVVAAALAPDSAHVRQGAEYAAATIDT